MNILITGGTGFIGSQIVTDLLKAGHHVTVCARNVNYAKNIFPNANIIECDFNKDTDKSVWIRRLISIDVVINCVGILHHPFKKNIMRIHFDTPKALFDAALNSHVKKIIHISALGIDKGKVDYATSKKAAEDYLSQLPITSIILRPSLVYGRGSYGGTSLFRGLAAFPFFIPVPGNGTQEFQPIHLQDLSKAVLHFVNSPSTQNQILSAVGPERISMKHILEKMRAWLGIEKAPIFKVPLFLIRMGSWFGNLIPYSSMNEDSYQMLMQNNVTDKNEVMNFQKSIDFMPNNFSTGLYNEPSTVQDHWHAGLYFLKPLLQFSIAFVWIWSGLCSAFWYSKEAIFSLLTTVGIPTPFQSFTLYGASALDILIGLTILCSYKVKKIALLQLFIIIIYTGIITITLPQLWIEPFAPIAKNIPLFVAIIIMMALESDR